MADIPTAVDQDSGFAWFAILLAVNIPNEEATGRSRSS
jgi:hypothetical protein